ncbi:hypothetical protein NCCP2716_25850 [Sporosarcina sp. NCCP-2716]|uniref:hypothetical protein n=1 Tax=Sporosarcina sp. NCCP-2716 TaxID=2943679 RepID=UPI00203C4AED|nr:hypothetical protein [Sporosarcina sp. NCCP-2716]GKV70087.1 hypothetical protein NCCP2716_25850 [Sporosarcina sp. NCCP-2716]
MRNDTAEKRSEKWDGFHFVMILAIVSMVYLLRLPDAAFWILTTGYALIIVFLDRKTSLRRILGFLALAAVMVLLRIGW